MAMRVAVALRSSMIWQIVAGFALGTLGTLVTHDPHADLQPSHIHQAQPWRIAR